MVNLFEISSLSPIANKVSKDSEESSITTNVISYFISSFITDQVGF